MGKKEHIIYVNENMDFIHDKSTELYEAMSDLEYENVVAICDQLISKLKEIKLDHTDETLL